MSWLCCKIQSYLLHLVTQRNRYEHWWTDKVPRCMNPSEGANWLFESSLPCSHNSHSLWYWYIPFLRMARSLAAEYWDRLSCLLSNPFFQVHQCWSCKLHGSAQNGSELNSLLAVTSETCSTWKSSCSLGNPWREAVHCNGFCWLSWRNRTELNCFKCRLYVSGQASVLLMGSS